MSSIIGDTACEDLGADEEKEEEEEEVSLIWSQAKRAEEGIKSRKGRIRRVENDETYSII